MPDTEQLHDHVESFDSFVELLESLDSEQYAHEWISATEGVGHQVEEVIDAEADELASHEIGALRLIWEAHHERRPAEETFVP